MTLNDSSWWSPGATASVQQTAKAIDEACRRRGGVYSQYSCKYVSWDDSSRTATGGGGLSCFGSNISDSYLKAKDDGRQLFTVRPNNWNEKLGTVSAADVAVLVGNTNGQTALQPVTLQDVLQNMGKYGGYVGLPNTSNLSKADLDAQVSIRFQTTFLPTPAAPKSPFGGVPAIGANASRVEFATEVYNYQTSSAAQPKNLILLCTTQGLAVQQDGPHKTRLYHHTVVNSSFGNNGGRPTIHRHWLEAEATRHAVGGPQQETTQEKFDALQRGKATASVIGPRALGERFNVLMTIQVPLLQQNRTTPFAYGSSSSCGFSSAWPAPLGVFFQDIHPLQGAGAAWTPPAPPGAAPAPSPFSPGHLPAAAFCAGFGAACAPPAPAGAGAAWTPPAPPGAAPAPTPYSSSSFHSTPPKTVTGISKAARVSKGGLYDITWRGLQATMPLRRHNTQRVTITVVLYNTVAGGVPTEADVVAAIDDLEKLYKACRATVRSKTTSFNDKGNSAGFPTPAPPAFTTGQPVVGFNSFPVPQAPKPGFGQASFSPMKDIPSTILGQTQGLPVSEEAINYLRCLGNTLLDDPSSDAWALYQSYCFFRLGNEMSVQVRGVQDPTHTYNMACACSRLSLIPTTNMLGNGAELMPGWVRQGAEKLRQASLSWLVVAVGAGWNNCEHMCADADLHPIRTNAAAAFQAVVHLVQQANPGF